MAMLKTPDRVVFKRFLMTLEPDELKNYLKEYEEKRQVRVIDEINKIKQGEMQSKLEVFHPVKACPYCQSTKFIKHNSKTALTRYRCKNCNSTFSITTDTFMSGTNWTWEIWVKLLQMTLNTMSLDEIVDTLEKDYKLDGINRKTVILARHKLIYAMSLMPKPKLHGVIQADETFFRENQKGTRTDLIDKKTGKRRELINVIPSVVPVRLPRRGYQPSRLGVMGPEYACVVCAVDDAKHAVSIVTSMGKVDPKMFTDHFDQYFENITYLCTDGSPIYKDYCILQNIPHYVRPSNFYSELRKAGYEPGVDSSIDNEYVQGLYYNNRKVMSKLYNDGLIDYIETKNSMPFTEFRDIKYKKGLNLGRVNAFHNYLKLNLEKTMTGVATKYLPNYIDAYTFMYNWRHEHDSTLSSMKDAEIVLTELVKSDTAFTLEDMKSMDFFVAPQPTGRYLALLDKATKEIRRKTDNKFFKFDEEDRVVSFDHRKYIRETPVGKLRPIGKDYKIKGYTRMTQWQLYSAIMNLPKKDIDDIVIRLIAEDKTFNIYTEDIKYIANNRIPNNELTYSMGTDMIDLERLFIIKYDDTENEKD